MYLFLTETSLANTGVIKWMKMNGACLYHFVGEMVNLYKIFVGTPERKPRELSHYSDYDMISRPMERGLILHRGKGIVSTPKRPDRL
jgi:hypothetical protein